MIVSAAYLTCIPYMIYKLCNKLNKCALSLKAFLFVINGQSRLFDIMHLFRIPSKPKLERPSKRLSKGSAVREHIVSLKRKQLYFSNGKPEGPSEAWPSSHPPNNSNHHHQVVPSSPSSSFTAQIEDPVLQSFDDIFCPRPVELKSIIMMKPGLDFKPRKSLSFDFNQDKTAPVYDKPQGIPTNETLHEEGNSLAGSGSLFVARNTQSRMISDEMPILAQPSSLPFNPVTFGIKNFYPREE